MHGCIHACIHEWHRSTNGDRRSFARNGIGSRGSQIVRMGCFDHRPCVTWEDPRKKKERKEKGKTINDDKDNQTGIFKTARDHSSSVISPADPCPGSLDCTAHQAQARRHDRRQAVESEATQTVPGGPGSLVRPYTRELGGTNSQGAWLLRPGPGVGKKLSD